MTRQQALDIYMVEAVLTSREVINLELDAPKPLVVGDVVGDVWVAVGDEGDDWKTGFGDVEVEQRHIDWANEIGCLDNLTAGAIRRVILQRKPPGRPEVLTGGKRVNTYLDDESVAIATRLGDGNMSVGIRRALKEARK